MKKTARILSAALCIALIFTLLMPCASAKEFIAGLDTENPGVNTQYKYAENDPSWLRQLTVKEDMLSAEGIATEAVLHPLTAYPYRTDAATFKKEVDDYVEMFTLDEESQRAAYLYILNQLGALTVISEPTVDDQTKAQWLRDKGIEIPPEAEQDANSTLMISALYALMRNDFYYVITGKTVSIPAGTNLEAAVLIYLMAFAGQNSSLLSFVQKYFGVSSIGTLEDYIYYTSLLSLFTRGYVRIAEVPTITRNEVYRRVAIMTIRESGLAVDSDAPMEEIQNKYLAAMLGQQYEIEIDPDALSKAVKNGTVAQYVIRRMAYEDAGLTISEKTKYPEAFEIALKNTDKFRLEDEFYSDIKSYSVYLNNLRDGVYINPSPISSSGVKVLINGTEAAANAYSKVMLTADKKQNISISVLYSENGVKKNSYYTLTVYQGDTPAEGSDITGIVSDIAKDLSIPVPSEGAQQLPGENVVMPAVSYINNAAPSLYDVAQRVLSINAAGQLVDQNGNVISDSAKQLPQGYVYSIDSNGQIAIVPAADEESTTAPAAQSTADELDENSEKNRYIIIGASVLALLMLIIIIAVVLHATGKKKKRSSSANAARKQKEKRKKEKKAARKAKRAK